jgi:uncharacterized protein YegP (UPF0339 family)
MARFVISTVGRGRLQFQLFTDEGGLILTGVGYDTKLSCRGDIRSVKRNAKNYTRYERKYNRLKSEHFFKMTDKGDFYIGNSPGFSDETQLELCIISVMKNAGDAEVEDRTLRPRPSR